MSSFRPQIHWVFPVLKVLADISDDGAHDVQVEVSGENAVGSYGTRGSPCGYGHVMLEVEKHTRYDSKPMGK